MGTLNFPFSGSSDFSSCWKGVWVLGNSISFFFLAPLLSISFVSEYFYSKNRQLKNDINSLHRRIEDLDRDIRKLRDTDVSQREQFSILKSLDNQSKEIQKVISETKEEKDCLTTATQLLKDSGIKTRIIKK